MAGESYSPNMNLVLPGVGVTAGPVYASDLNQSLNIVDQHNHAPGSGVQITPDGLNINSNFTMNNNNIIAIKSLRLQDQVSALSSGSDLGCMYRVADDLYYNDGLGNQIRLTQSGSVAGTSGSIANLVSPASATFVSLSSTIVFESDVTVPASLDAGSLLMRNLSAGSFALTLSPPAAMGADYAITLPSLPSSQKIMTLDASGNMSAPYVVDNSTIEVSSNTIQLKDAGITSAKLGTSLNLPGTNVRANSRRVVVSASNPVSSGNTAIVSGCVSLGINMSGAGWSASLVNRFTSGIGQYMDQYQVIFSTPFLSNTETNVTFSPVITYGGISYNQPFTLLGDTYAFPMLYSWDAASFTVILPYTAGTSSNYSGFTFIATGPI